MSLEGPTDYPAEYAATSSFGRPGTAVERSSVGIRGHSAAVC